MLAFTRFNKFIAAKLFALLSFTILLLSSPVGAQVYAEFTTGVIAEYTGPNANQNDFAVEFQYADKPISSVIISQTCDFWGCGTASTQGNDTTVNLEIFFQDGSPSVSVPGAFNWVLNKSGGGIHYFGIVFDSSNQPNDGLTLINGSAKKTYILPIPGEEQVLLGRINTDNTDGSANFGSNEIGDLIDALTLYFTSSIELVKSYSPFNDLDNRRRMFQHTMF